MTQLLIAGLPGTGKSEFSRWLKETHGYLHIEVDSAVENDPVVQLLVHRDVFNVQGVADNLLARGPDVVLDWGFVPSLLGRVRQVIRRGFEPWWFSGEEDAARLAFKQSARAPEALFDLQLADIRSSWARIGKVFDDRVLDVVRSTSDGFVCLEPAEVFEMMAERRRSLSMGSEGD
ncbi:MAG: hypothetical protein ABSG36_11780 [Acidimicrobiales bacterium]|jgi:hypothetical protein